MANEDSSLYKDWVLTSSKALAADLEEFGSLIANQGLTDLQKIQATVVRLADQIERNEALARAYLQRAVTELGQDSRAADLLTKTADQQLQVVSWLRSLQAPNASIDAFRASTHPTRALGALREHAVCGRHPNVSEVSLRPGIDGLSGWSLRSVAAGMR
ncbi:MAG: hypothetical protein FIA97_15130 [Methylococcaceae bacterium]|nr:hypothetical protein [Methylococcaceae bacterium]